MLGVITLDGSGLTSAAVARIADGEDVALDPRGMARAEAAWRTMTAIAATRPLYGRATGVGANRDVVIPPTEYAAHGARLLASHAAAAGPELPAPLVRATLAVRANQLAAGGSGIRPDVLAALVARLARGAAPLPHVRDGGSIGTADLTALAQVGLALDLELDGGDALALMSSNALTLARAALARTELERVARASLVVAALTVRAVDGSPEAFATAVHTARPHPGQYEAAAVLRELLAGSGDWVAARVQDSYGIRAAAQAAGPLLDAVVRLDRTLTIELNAAAENPMVDVDGQTVLHHANFHLAALAVDLDATRLALQQHAALSVARLAELMEPVITGLAPFLAAGAPGSSGVLVLEYAAQAALGRLRQAAHPTSLGGATVSRGVEDHAPVATEGARQLEVAVDAAREAVACELVAAVRAIGQKGVALDGRLGAALAEAAARFDPDMADRDLGPDLRAGMAVLDALAPYAIT